MMRFKSENMSRAKSLVIFFTMLKKTRKIVFVLVNKKIFV